MTEIKTKVIDILDKKKISYKILLHKEPAYTVETAAEQRGVDKNLMVKSILLVNAKQQYLIACISGGAVLDSKALRSYLTKDWKRIRFASEEELMSVTGYVQGTVGPIGIPGNIPVIFDEYIGKLVKVNISSGNPMAGIELLSKDLIKLVNPKFACIAKRG